MLHVVNLCTYICMYVRMSVCNTNQPILLELLQIRRVNLGQVPKAEPRFQSTLFLHVGSTSHQCTNSIKCNIDTKLTQSHK